MLIVETANGQMWDVRPDPIVFLSDPIVFDPIVFFEDINSVCGRENIPVAWRQSPDPYSDCATR
jgi:hypothetical protein